jgi:LPS sulfotransferase NodH
MKLSTPFIQLPVRFDAERLADELAQFTESDWNAHPLNYQGNSALRLITANGGANDAISGEMMPTPYLQRCEYVQQVLGAFDCVWSRSRFMRLQPGAVVPPHCDINYHWINRTRIHIPVITHPDVKFICDGQQVHMAAGEAWIFDNWRQHTVQNNSNITRIHLVADTAGSPYFWDLVSHGDPNGAFHGSKAAEIIRHQANHRPTLLTERFSSHVLMPVSEVKALCQAILEDLPDADSYTNPTLQATLCKVLSAFMQVWESMWYLYGDSPAHLHHYRSYVQQIKSGLMALPDEMKLRSNGQSVIRIIQLHVLAPAVRAKFLVNRQTPMAQIEGKTRDFFDRPVFVVAAPRSGSTLLFETLACASDLSSIGGESHSIFETIPALSPVHPDGCESNRLLAADATPAISDAIRRGFASLLRDHEGNAIEIGDVSRVRLLDKLPKNALRIPFIQKIFPDALYIYLYREPWQSISSMMEAWQSGKWVTYREIIADGKPWSLLLTPNWRELQSKPLEYICASQWVEANQHIMSDLQSISPNRYICVNYDDLMRDTNNAVASMCDFANIKFDRYLRERVVAELPLSRYTQTSPDPKKWERHYDAIKSVEPVFTETIAQWQRFRMVS